MLFKHKDPIISSEMQTDHTGTDDSIATVTDPRGAIATYKYGSVDSDTSETRPLLTRIAYTSPDTTNIADPTDVVLTYDNAGNRLTMTDGSGSLSYSYDELSRARVETRNFADTLQNASSGGYKLEYSYTLAGGIKSIKDPNATSGWEVTYATDKTGRTTSIGGSGFGSQTSFATDIAYRAFGGVKSMSYSTTAATNISLTYDTRLRPATYESESSANTVDIQNKTYTYNSDGSIKQAADNVESKYGQVYEYDFASRLKKNQFGTGSASPTPQYKQILGYDAFSNLTNRQTWDKDNVERSFAAAYTNNRKTSGGYGLGIDTHDNAGNVVENIVSYAPVDKRTWKFDAAGRMTDWLETSKYSGTTFHDQGEVLTFDGDGRVAKRNKKLRVTANPPNAFVETPEYKIYSSVTGSLITQLDQTGQKTKTNIYLGGSAIAEHSSGSDVLFKHTDPITRSEMQTDLAGTIPQFDYGRVELNATGDVIPTQEPEIQEPPHDFGKGGSINNPESGCTWDGTPIPCSMVPSILSEGKHDVYVNTRAEGGWSLYHALNAQISTWRFDVYKVTGPRPIPFVNFLRPVGFQGIEYVGSFYWSFISPFLETITTRLDNLQNDKIRLTSEEVEALRGRAQAEVERNEICAEFIENLAFATLGERVSAKDLLNEGIDRANRTLGIYWADYPGAGAVATSHKIGSPHENKAEIWYDNKKQAMYAPAVAGLIHEILHVALRATDMELSAVVRDLGIEVIRDDGRTLEYPTDPDNKNLAYSGYWGQALKNHCGPGTINRRVVPK